MPGSKLQCKRWHCFQTRQITLNGNSYNARNSISSPSPIQTQSSPSPVPTVPLNKCFSHNLVVTVTKLIHRNYCTGFATVSGWWSALVRVQTFSRWDYRRRDQEIGTCMGCVCSGKKWQIEVIKNGSGHILFLAYAAIWELYSHGLPTSTFSEKKSGKKFIVVSNPIVSMNWYQEVILLQEVLPPPPT
jgi:hypothetical protein